MKTTIIILLAIGLSQSAAGQPADDCFNYDADHLRGIGALIGVDSAHSVAVAGALAAVAAWDEGLVLVDLANPEWPLEIGRIDTPGYVRSVAIAGGLVYAVDVGGLGLMVVDLARAQVTPGAGVGAGGGRGIVKLGILFAGEVSIS